MGSAWLASALWLGLRVSFLVPVLLLGVSGCASYDPPVRGDHTSERYKADLEKCSTSSTETVRRKNAATPGSWIMSPITGPPEVRAAIRKCMESKGYAPEKTD
jgi:hypothetical protein